MMNFCVQPKCTLINKTSIKYFLLTSLLRGFLFCGVGMNKLPSDYFLDVDDDLLAFLEKQGEECAKEIYKSNTVNIENAYKLLNILIVGIGSAFLLLTQKPIFAYLTMGLATFLVCWVLCAGYLVLFCLRPNIRGAVFTSPNRLYTQPYKAICDTDYKNLEIKGFKAQRKPLTLIRRYRLIDLCATADELIDINIKIRKHLNRVRIATILTPILSMTISAITYYFF